MESAKQKLDKMLGIKDGESIDDFKDVKYSIKFIDKVTQEVIKSKDEFVSVINNYIHIISHLFFYFN